MKTYLMQSGDKYKIGQAKSPIARRKQLQTGSSEKIEVVSYCDESLVSEKQLHELYSSDRDEGEWFNLSEDDVSNILTLMQDDDSKDYGRTNMTFVFSKRTRDKLNLLSGLTGSSKSGLVEKGINKWLDSMGLDFDALFDMKDKLNSC